MWDLMSPLSRYCEESGNNIADQVSAQKNVESSGHTSGGIAGVCVGVLLAFFENFPY